ncbi:MAG: RluA family pseudouridine synthase [Oscillospiraceae bacterium]|nr:RNA pseudouridine synthase [Bacillota bacterium]
MEFIYQDSSILVCVKPAGVLSTDEPGGMPELARAALGEPQGCVRTVHRLDRVVSGLMVLARTPEAASQLSRQIREQRFEKEYLAVLHGCPQAPEGALRDLLRRDKAERKTYVTEVPGKDVQEAILSYRLLGSCNGLSQVHIRLQTGRTHQIRAQFSARGLPLVGDRKYSLLDDGCPIALWSHCLRFCHPVSGKPMTFRLEPPPIFPWTLFCD